MRTVNAALDLVGLAAACVAAGSGDVDLLAKFRARHHDHTLSYGNQMAAHMALGLTFLGGGRFTLADSPEAVAFLLIAFFPPFPTASGDSRAHLQAFRHLWVLAVEPRMTVAQNVVTHRSEKVELQFNSADGSHVRHDSTPTAFPSKFLGGSITVDHQEKTLAPTTLSHDPVVIGIAHCPRTFLQRGSAKIERLSKAEDELVPQTFEAAKAYDLDEAKLRRFAGDGLRRTEGILDNLLYSMRISDADESADAAALLERQSKPAAADGGSIRSATGPTQSTFAKAAEQVQEALSGLAQVNQASDATKRMLAALLASRRATET